MTAALVLNGPVTAGTKIEGGFVACADGGFEHVKNAGLTPDVIIGDMDSVRGEYIPAGVELVKFPKEKNKTDGVLSLEYLIKRGFSKINIYGGTGGRPDHACANLFLLPLAKKKNASAVLRDALYEVRYLSAGKSGETVCVGAGIGATVSFLPENETLLEFSEGLKYPLKGLRIRKHSSRGVSNEAIAESFTLRLVRGAGYLYVLRDALKF